MASYSTSKATVGGTCDILTWYILTMNLRYLNLHITPRIIRTLLAVMKGGENYQDMKLSHHPLVVSENLQEEKIKPIEIQSYDKREKMKFLLKLGLFSNEKHIKDLSSTLKYKSVPLYSKACGFGSEKKKKFCCVGLASKPCVKWYAGDTYHWDAAALNNDNDNNQISLRQLKLSPRICVKKWLGGERIVNSRRNFRILENALIPKTGNHSYCKEKPITPLSNNSCGSESPRKLFSLLKKGVNQKRNKSLIPPELSLKNGADNVKHFGLPKSHLRISNRRKPSKLPMQKMGQQKRMKIVTSLNSERSININGKELKICLKRWEGKETIRVSKEKQYIKEFLTIPTGSSHRACRKAKVMENPGSCIKCTTKTSELSQEKQNISLKTCCSS